jgi:CRP/FNR family transcriptional regulator
LCATSGLPDGRAVQQPYAIRFALQNLQVSGRRSAITGFQMAGELLGMDAIGADHHHCDAVAGRQRSVRDPFAGTEELFASADTAAPSTASGQKSPANGTSCCCGNMRAEQRFAVFLINLSARYAARGYSATQFQLRMSREDIGNYLGLTIESISRLLSRFKKQGLLAIDKREVTLLQPELLRAMAAGTEQCHPMS